MKRIKQSHSAIMKNVLLIYFFALLGTLAFLEPFIAQTTSPWSIIPLTSINSPENDVPFGVDSSYVYIQQDGVNLRSPRFTDPEHPGELEKVDIVAVRDEAWDELGEIQHVSIDDARGLAVISARPYPGASDYDLFISSTLEPSRFKNSESPQAWSKAYPLLSLNSSADEVFPQFIEGGLYFASNRNKKDFDIYFAPRNLQWHVAISLESPINSEADELSIVVLNDFEMYVCSNRAESQGFDIFLLSKPNNEPLALGYFLELSSAGTSVQGVKVKWVEKEGVRRGTTVFESTTNHQGLISLDELPSSRVLSMRVGTIESPVEDGTIVRIINPKGEVVREYTINSSGVLSVDFLPLDSINDLEFRKSLDLSVLPNRTPPLYTLFFDLNISIPTSKSTEQLELWWRDNSQEFISSIRDSSLLLEGHADVTGTTESNEDLSEKRAIWFKDWLVSKGIDPSSVSTRGMGARFPVEICPEAPVHAPNCPPEVHAANRRVELRWKVG
jgi:hypothetical protein